MFSSYGVDMQDKPSFEEISNRIRQVAEFHGGKLPLEHALVWEGYIAALAEWQLISIAEHERLLRLLGKTPAEPGLTIFLGPEGARDAMKQEAPKKKRVTHILVPKGR